MLYRHWTCFSQKWCRRLWYWQLASPLLWLLVSKYLCLRDSPWVFLCPDLSASILAAVGYFWWLSLGKTHELRTYEHWSLRCHICLLSPSLAIPSHWWSCSRSTGLPPWRSRQTCSSHVANACPYPIHPVDMDPILSHVTFFWFSLVLGRLRLLLHMH